MSGKTRPALTGLLHDLQADRAAYERLQERLEAQFQAALRHDAPGLQQLAEDIGALVGELEARARARGQVLRQLLGTAGEVSMAALLNRLPPAAAQAIGGLWGGLEQQVRDCKALNARNGRLIADQHALMRRVMGVEEALYAER